MLKNVVFSADYVFSSEQELEYDIPPMSVIDVEIRCNVSISVSLGVKDSELSFFMDEGRKIKFKIETADFDTLIINNPHEGSVATRINHRPMRRMGENPDKDSLVEPIVDVHAAKRDPHIAAMMARMDNLERENAILAGRQSKSGSVLHEPDVFDDDDAFFGNGHQVGDDEYETENSNTDDQGDGDIETGSPTSPNLGKTTETSDADTDTHHRGDEDSEKAGSPVGSGSEQDGT